MIIIDVEQRSEAWFQEKAGRFGASKGATLMSSISTKGFKDLITDIAGEIITGEIEPGYTNEIMQRGIDLEPEACREMEAILGVTLREVGLCLPEDSVLQDWVGVSPDRLTPDNIPIEVKCPMRKTHLNYLQANRLPNEYKWQVQMQLFVTGANKAYFMSYYPNMKPFIIEVLPDYEMHNQMLERFEVAIKDVKEQIKNYNNYE